ncbi:MAG TPA: arsenate reductase ArsC [Thermodesulfobacteriaceae bacterium]|nr:arsenate reductase ArsC [Thermodesulfobacteriaceae bacterium]
MEKKVLFLCTQNACRSQMAEGMVNGMKLTGVRAFSAGTMPFRVHPLALKALKEAGVDTGSARSKHVDEFRGKKFDLVITLCSKAREACPVWPAQGKRLHFGLPDPAEAPGTEEERLMAFRRVLELIEKELLPLVERELGLKAD